MENVKVTKETNSQTTKKIFAGIVAIFSILYLLNPTGGFFELLPDNLPVIGNLDEVGVTSILIWALKTLFGS